MTKSPRFVRQSAIATGCRALGHIPLFMALFTAFPTQWCLGAGKTMPGGKVVLVRGVLTVFSLGLDELAEQLTQRGYSTEVVPASLAYPTVDNVCRKYANGELTGPLVLIGHSLGGDLLPGLAERLAADRRQADLLIMIDSTFPSNCPPNVRRCINLYQSNFSPDWFRIFRGAPIQSTNPSTELVNLDVRKSLHQSEAAKLNHFNIEASPWIHGIVIKEVDQVMTIPPERHLRASAQGSEAVARTLFPVPILPAGRFPVCR